MLTHPAILLCFRVFKLAKSRKSVSWLMKQSWNVMKNAWNWKQSALKISEKLEIFFIPLYQSAMMRWEQFSCPACKCTLWLVMVSLKQSWESNLRVFLHSSSMGMTNPWWGEWEFNMVCIIISFFKEKSHKYKSTNYVLNHILVWNINGNQTVWLA